MPEFINLVPDAEKQEQVKSKAVKVSTILTIVLLLVVGGIAAWVFFSNSQLQNRPRVPRRYLVAFRQRNSSE